MKIFTQHLTSCLLFIAYLSVTSACPSSSTLRFGVFGRLCISSTDCIKQSYVIFGESCVRACPPRTKYFETTHTCYLTCPNDSIQLDTECLNGSHCLAQNQVLYNGSCQSSCSAGASFIKYGTCYNRCPSDTVVNGSECIYDEDCIEEGYVFNRTCVKVCPSAAHYQNEGLCFDACPQHTVSNISDTNCFPIQECTNILGYVVYDSICMPSCPSEAPYTLNGKCYALCPQNYVLNTSQSCCISAQECMATGFYIHNKTCVESCPVYHARYHSLNMCYSQCPSGYVIHVDQCIDQYSCTNNYNGLYYVIFNGTCLPSCPQESPYNHNGFCVHQCSNVTFVKDLKCIDNDQCTYYGNYWYGDQCLFECPKEAPVIYGVSCLQACPFTLVSENITCISVDECISKGKYVFNNTCYFTCPKETHSHVNGHCLTRCPDGKVYNGTICIPSNECKLISQSNCVLSCPETLPYMTRNTCVKQCPYDTVMNGTRCIPTLNCTKKIFNRTCMEICPKEAPFEIGNICYSMCPFGYGSFSGSLCVDLNTCKRFSNGTIIHNNETCMTSCPAIAPYVYNNKMVCLSQCPKGTVAEGYTCIPELRCHDVVYKGQCLKSCPSEVPYKWYKGCKVKCPDLTVVKDKECVYESSCNTIFNRRCMTNGQCPKEAMFKKDNTCYSKCPDQTVVKDKECVYESSCNTIFNRTCVTNGQCPNEARFKKDNTCYSKCPDGTLVDNNHTTCIQKYDCEQKNGFIKGTTCVPECPNGFISVPAINNICYDLIMDKREAVIMSILILITFTCVVFLIYNPKRQVKKHDRPAENEDDNLENGLGKQFDFATRNKQRRTAYEEDEVIGEQMIAMDERRRDVDDDCAMIVVHSTADDYDTGSDDPLLYVGDNQANSGTENDDDALLFGDGVNHRDWDGGAV